MPAAPINAGAYLLHTLACGLNTCQRFVPASFPPQSEGCTQGLRLQTEIVETLHSAMARHPALRGPEQAGEQTGGLPHSSHGNSPNHERVELH